jgi:ABC-type transport system involved in multi-copper enzyme maturation permease subunit
MNIGRVGVIAQNVFWEVIRDRVLYWVGIYTIFYFFAAQFLPKIAGGTEAKILLDLALAATEIFTLIIAVFVGTNLVNQEIEKRTVLVLIAKPVGRGEFILGKHLGLAAVLAVLLSLMLAIALVILQVSQIPQLPLPWGSLLIASLFTFLQIALLIAVAIAFGVFSSSLLATLLTFAVYLMGHFSRDLLEFGRLTENPALEQLTRGLYLILPDLSRLDLKNQAVYNLLPPTPVLLENALYGVLYTGLLLAIATLIFSRREF